MKGLVRPRVETGGRRSPRNLGGEVAGTADRVLGMTLTPWQRYVADRATELDASGALRWPTVVVTVARGAGKSWLIQALMTWRLLQAQRFGQPQELVSVAQTQGVARLSWERPARRMVELDMSERTTWGRGLESVALPDQSIWRVLAARLSATTGYRASMIAVDEAWSVPREVVEQGLVPQTRRRNQPQILIVSTAGDGRSDLLTRYRDRALGGDPGILLLEWSADPTWPSDSRNAWRWANPDYDQDTEQQLVALARSTPEARFRSQYLNQWVNAVDGWLPPSVWAAGNDPEVEGAGGGVVAVDCAPDGDGWGAVHADRAADGRIVLRAHYTTRAAQLWPWVEAHSADARVLLGASVDGLQPDTVRRSGTFGAREIREWLPGVRQTVVGGGIVHDGHRTLAEHVLRARTTQTTAGLVLKVGGDPHELCRTMIAAVGAAMRGKVPTLV